MSTTEERKIDRRGLLKATAGLAAVGAVLGVPALVFKGSNDGDAQGTTASTESASLEASQPIVAFIQDAAKGEVVIMSGTEQVVVTDRDLVARILMAGRA